MSKIIVTCALAAWVILALAAYSTANRIADSLDNSANRIFAAGNSGRG